MIALPPGVRDVVIVGAGPAGSITARTSALLGASVLLVDRAVFPRPKVCGSCLSPVALTTLDALGLGEVVRRAGAVALSRMEMTAGKRCVTFRLPSRAVLSREVLDMLLVRAAIDAGVEFADGTRAEIGPCEGGARPVTLRRRGTSSVVRARVVIDASGLGRSAPSAACRIGAGCSVAASDRHAPGTISMACARPGYVGAVIREDGRLDVAAALDPAFARAVGGPASAAGHILAAAGAPPIAQLESARWRGTPRLTYRPRTLATDRLCRVGDAAGYVEPFTGEGIGWALAGGMALAPLAVAATREDTARRDLPACWTRTHAALLGRRHRACRATTRLLRTPGIAACSVRALEAIPALTAPAVRWVGGSCPR